MPSRGSHGLAVFQCGLGTRGHGAAAAQAGLFLSFAAMHCGGHLGTGNGAVITILFP